MISFSKKIIIFDLDGTLTESKQPLNDEMALLLSRLTIKVPVAVIGGASFEQFKKQFLPRLESQNLNADNLIILPTSGSQVYEYDKSEGKWRLIHEESFPPEVKRKAIAALEEIIDSGEYDIPAEKYGEYIEDRGTQITLSALGQEAPIEKKQIWDPDHKKRERIKNILEQKLSGVDISIGGMTSIDILPAGLNKAAGIKRLLERKNFSMGDAVFIGDALFPGGNDYSVLEAGIETISVKGPKETAKIIKSWL